ncbi:hypothetical protein CBF28_11760 [Vagococcus carniphilus]|uniref:SdpI family protein n=2 Tax=Vagococcus carniphilus TaxID=218144 RepID=A0A430AU98_9ENTE|nr:hypothetical protein CBF28_11760 [Vagococcus carniphilus]
MFRIESKNSILDILNEIGVDNMIFYFVGIVLTVVGFLYLVFPSKNRVNKYGYRTQRAKMSEASYDYAQKVASRTFLMIGIPTFIIGFLLKQFGLIHFFILEVLLIGIPIIRIFYLIERKLETFNDNEEGVAVDEITNDRG